jgi:glycosyltransferase involved in cell wall biosynthesis
MGIKRIIIFNTAQVQDLIGGSQAAIEDSIDEFLDQNFDVIFVSYNFNNTKNYCGPNFSRIFITKFWSNPFYFIFDVLLVFFLINIKSFNFLWVNAANPAFLFVPFIRSKKSIYTFHGPIIEEQTLSLRSNFKIFLTKSIYKIFLNYFNFLHYNTNYVKNSVENEYPFTKKYNFNVLEILVNENKFLRQINNNVIDYIDKSKVNLLIPRRLVKRTGVANFIKSLLLIDNSIFKNFNFYITGDGEQKNEIISLIKNIDNIYFLGLVDNSTLNNIFCNVDAIVIPSIGAEGFCLPAKQSILLNKFVLHTGQGGLPETLNNYDKAILFNFNNLNSLVEGLIYILKNKNTTTNNLPNNQFINNFKTIFNDISN